jgi:hypothetical protein
MYNKWLFISTTLAILELSNAAYACQFDTDCWPGSKCVKSGGSIYGICAGGLFPGNSNDETPVYSPLDPNGTVGDTCNFDVDCGPGNHCFKQNSIYGVCTRR